MTTTNPSMGTRKRFEVALSAGKSHSAGGMNMKDLYEYMELYYGVTPEIIKVHGKGELNGIV